MAKVLIIEDDLVMIETMTKWLEHEHYQVEAVDTADEGRHRILTCSYDVILMDFELPDGTGIDLIKDLRSAGSTTPVLLVTGRQSIEDKEAGFQSGSDDYITKPFHIKELSLRIKALLKRSSNAINVLKFGPLEMELERFRVAKNGDEITLLPKEFALLEFFLRNPNQVFSAEALLERVWKSESESSPEAVVVCIRRLRKKIDDEGAPSLIQTVHGVGYKLQEPKSKQP